MTSITLEFAGLPPEAAKCAACIDRLVERLRALSGVHSVEVIQDRHRVTLALNEAAEPRRIEAAARQIMTEVADGYVHDRLRIGGMDCPSCAAEIETALRSKDGVAACSVDFPAARLSVEYELGRITIPQIQAEVRKLGFSGQPVRDEVRQSNIGQVIPLFVGGPLYVAAWFVPETGPFRAVLFALSAVVSGWRMFLPGLISLGNLRFSTNTLMTAAVVGAAAIGEWEEAAAVAWLFALGNFLQARTISRTRSAINELIDSSPKSAVLVRDGESREVDVNEIIAGDLVEVRPFASIPVDGIVETGEGYVDTAMVTGEAEPIWASKGTQVLAGTAAGASPMRIRAEKDYSNSTLAKMLDLIESGQAARAPQQEMIDRVTAWYTPVILVVAVAAGLLLPLFGLRSWHDGMHQAFWLLMVACPCALVISIPVAAVAAIGAAGRFGAMIKGGAYLESVATVRHWAFDKTGTLTHSRLTAEPLELSQPNALSIAGALASHSSHPVSAAVYRRTKGSPLPMPENVEEVRGMGVEGIVDGRTYRLGSASFTGATAAGDAFLTEAGRLLASFKISEDRRTGASDALAEIMASGASVVLLSGDQLAKAQAVAQSVGVGRVVAEAHPDEKARHIEELASAGGVAMVGDGVNDAAALQRATVGIAMGAAGSDAAIQSADIVLLSDDIANIPRLLRLGRKFRSILAENIIFSLGTKGILLIAGAFAVLPFWLAVAGDMGVSLLVTANALRLRK